MRGDVNRQALTLQQFTAALSSCMQSINGTREVIVLVIQVAGSGGTYPVEMLPKFFQVLYAVMPFKYSMNAMRETISGSYNGTYAKCILVLLLMAVIAIPVGLLLHVVCRPYLKRSDASKANTAGLMRGS